MLWNTAHSTPAPAALSGHDGDSFRILASELVIDLDRYAMNSGRDGLAVAVWPHAVGDVPVPPHVAGEINDRLLSALLSEGGHRHRLVARDALRAVAEDLAESADLTGSLDGVLAALAERAKADVLVVSKLRALGGGRMLLSYRAVSVDDGSIVAATSHREVQMSPSAMNDAATVKSLEQALQEAARALSAGLDDAEALHLQGIAFADSGRETPFGRYVEGRLADALAESTENPITGRSIMLRYTGPMKTPAETPRQGLHDVPGVYRLSGNYWDFGDVVELRLSLQDREGPVVVWRERVRAASLPETLRRRPLEAVAGVADQQRGPSPSAVSPPPREPATTSLETTDPRLVFKVQRSLRRLGYRPGPVDGIPGPMTRAAVHGYQRDHGLPADGRITSALAGHLSDSMTRLATRHEEAYRIGVNRRTDRHEITPTSARQGPLPAGYIPPPGYCRVWFDHWTPNLQPPPAPCDEFVGPVPDGARLVFGSEAWPPTPPGANALAAGLTDDHGALRGLTRADRTMASSSYAHASTAPLGRAIERRDRRSGNAVRTVPSREDLSPHGGNCREVSRSVIIAGRSQQAYSIACQEADGSWQLVGQ